MPVHIVGRHEKNNDLQYWLSKSHSDRISAVEFLREQHYALSGYKTIPRMVKDITIRKRSV